jgi:hypothetical protein
MLLPAVMATSWVVGTMMSPAIIVMVPSWRWPMGVVPWRRVGRRRRSPGVPTFVDNRWPVVHITGAGVKGGNYAPEIKTHIDPTAGFGLSGLQGDCEQGKS